MPGQSIFVYGTLLFPELQKALLGRYPETEPAQLEGYDANIVSYGQHYTNYPVLKPVKDGIVKGLVLNSLSETELDILKFYEGDEYCLETKSISVHGRVRPLKTFVYTSNENIEYGPTWEMEYFRNNYLNDYIFELVPNLLRDFKKQG